MSKEKIVIPSDLEISLVAKCKPGITSIGVSYKDSGFHGDIKELLVINGKHRFIIETFFMLDVKPGFPRHIAKVKPEIVKRVDAYQAWIVENAAEELAELKRLKRKYES